MYYDNDKCMQYKITCFKFPLTSGFSLNIMVKFDNFVENCKKITNII